MAQGPSTLDETLPSGDHGPSPVARPSQPTGFDETLASGESAPGQATRPTGGGASTEPLDIARGTAIGRYLVVEPLGSGTMGLVVAAFDPTLDRKVAIKIVRPDPSGTTSGRQRLQREAQAMAKLQHPNVVTVFEVGTFDDRVFLAMEYIAGSTLADWLAATPRSRREIISAFVAAGSGLAAAHSAGIVHRDFKPTNVLVGKDGRVRVADFGLATAPAESAPPRGAIARDSDPGPLGMTKTGALLGTPAYMSPEQHAGHAADARADQFSFCVALYEALYKQLPFEGGTFLVYHDNVLAGRIREPPRGSDVPSRIHRALMRGLAREPGDRYPDMEMLLRDLAFDPAATNRRIAWIGGAAVAIGAVAVLALRSSGTDDPCAAADQPLADVWTLAQRQAVEAAIRASGSPGAVAELDRLAHDLDERASALRTARREACLATAVRHEQSPELLDRRMQCIDQRADATRALIHVLADDPTGKTAMHALDAVLSLPRLEPCSDRAALLSDVPLPAPAIRPQVDALASRLDHFEAMERAGVYTKTFEGLGRLLPEIDKLGYAPLAARAHDLASGVLIDLGQTAQAATELRRTAELAAAAHDDELVARAWIGLLAEVGDREGHFDEARGIEAAAAAAVVRAGNDPELVGDLENSRGLVDLGRDKYLDAAAHFRAAADAQEKAGPAKLRNVAMTLSNAGTALTWAGKLDDARAAFERSLAINLELFGPDHPNVATTYHGLGILADDSGKPEDALNQFQKAVAIDVKVYPPDSPQTAKDQVSIGLVLEELERYGEALTYQQRAVATFEKDPANRRELCTALLDLGFAYEDANRARDAVTTLTRALDITVAEYGAESDETAKVLGGLMDASDSTGDHAKAREYGQRALAIDEKNLGPDHEQVARILGDLAENANLRHAAAEAMPLIERALAIIEKPGAPDLAVRYEMREIRARALLALGRIPAALADARTAQQGFAASHEPQAAAGARLVAADALWRQGKHRDAMTEAKAALATVQGQPHPDPEVLGKARAWLGTHGAH